MNDYQTAQQASYTLIVKEAENYPESVALIPSFDKGIVRLKAIVTEIHTIGIQQAKDITGVTGDKHTVLEGMIDYLVDVSGAVNSYAIASGDKTLQAKVNYKVSAVSRMTQSELIIAAAIVIEEAEKIAPETLADEGITAAELTAFKAAHAKFKEIVSDPREAVIDRSGYTRRLGDLFSEASDLKKNTLDRLASQFQRKAPEFYQKYKAAVTVIYRRSAKTTTTDTTTTVAKG